jgi:predicted amidophosphoribosyltransferase
MDNFCINCGSPISYDRQNHRLCDRCIDQLDTNYNYCPICGSDITYKVQESLMGEYNGQPAYDNIIVGAYCCRCNYEEDF